MDCAETIDCLGWYNHFNNINHSNPQIQCMFPSLYVVSNFFHQYLSFPSAGLLLPQGGLYLAFYSLWYNADSESLSDMSDSLRPHGLYSPWNSPGQNTGVGSIFLLQGISPTQESNPGLPHCRQTLYQLSHKGSPRILEWVWDHFLNFSSCYFIVSVQKCNRLLCIYFISCNFTEFVDEL